MSSDTRSESSPQPSQTQYQPLILVIDDEPPLVDAIAYSLRREGWRVETAMDGESAITMSRALAPDLVVLDVMLPGLDGFQVCRALRAESSVPILMLSARGEDVDRILGLELGADDYLTKPFVMRELVARVRANLRRNQMLTQGAQGALSDNAGSLGPAPSADANHQTLSLAGVTLDKTGREAFLHGRPLTLKPKEFDLLFYLMDHAGRAISREVLLRDVWHYDFAIDTRTVDVHIRGLRQKIEDDPSHPGRIQTVRGFGYRFTTDTPLTGT